MTASRGGGTKTAAAPKPKVPPVPALLDVLKEAIVAEYPKGANRARALLACDEIVRELEGGTPEA